MMYFIFRVVEVIVTLLVVVVPTFFFFYILFNFKKHVSILFIIILVVVNLVYFNKFFLGYFLAQPDFNRFLIPFFNFFSNSIKDLKPPFWNYLFGYGFDNWRISTAPFYGPFNFLAILFSTYTFLNMYVVTQHIILSVSAFILGRALKLSKIQSFAFSIFWTFNGWVCMRLTESVGYEYLVSYKWLPLCFAAATPLVKRSTFKNVLILGLLLGFLFEGTPNVAIPGTLSVFLYYLAISYKKVLFVDILFRFIKSGLIGMLFFLPKLLPAVLSIKDVSYSARIMWKATGWRASLIDISGYYKYLFPFNGNGVSERGFFTPGILGISLVFIFFISLLLKILKRKKIRKTDLVFASMFATGVILSSNNLLSHTFWSLPILDRVTRIPSSLIFISASFPWFIISAINKLTELKRLRRYSMFIMLLLSLMVFLEILVGPKFFGVDSYTFNFIKFKPKEELNTFDYLDKIDQNAGPVFSLIPADMLLPMYVSSTKGILSLNTIHYFLGNSYINSTLINETEKGIDLYNPKYILSVNEPALSNLTLAKSYEVDDYQHKERSYQLDRAKLVGKWDGIIRIYENKSYDPSWVNMTLKINEFEIDNRSIDARDGLLPLSYNRYWVSLNGQKLELDSESGLLKVAGNLKGGTTKLIYFPWVIYLSFVPFLVLFIFYLFKTRRNFF